MIKPLLIVPIMTYEKISRKEYLKAWKLTIYHINMFLSHELDVEGVTSCFCDYITSRPDIERVIPELEVHRFDETRYVESWASVILQVKNIAGLPVTSEELLKQVYNYWEFEEARQ